MSVGEEKLYINNGNKRNGNTQSFKLVCGTEGRGLGLDVKVDII